MIEGFNRKISNKDLNKKIVILSDMLGKKGFKPEEIDGKLVAKKGAITVDFNLKKGTMRVTTSTGLFLEENVSKVSIENGCFIFGGNTLIF